MRGMTGPKDEPTPTARSGPHAHGARAADIVAALSGGTLSSEEVFAAFEELDALPPEGVRAALLAWTGPGPDPERLDAPTRAAHGFAPPRLVLEARETTRDADVLFLGEVVEEQLRQVGLAWDGVDLAAEERLDGERPDAFTDVIHRVLAAPGGAPLFDVLVHDEGSGLIFRAGTAQIVGAVADGIVEMKDRVARRAIADVLAEPLPPAPEVTTADRAPASEPPASDPAASQRPASEPPASEPPASEPPASQPPASEDAQAEDAPKKRAAKKTTVKKTAVKKAAAKKGSATKSAKAKAADDAAAPSKTATKRASAKKSSAKASSETATGAKKKAATKKTAAKKATAKKTSAKKKTSADDDA